MKGSIGKTIFLHPSTHPTNHIHIVIHSRDNEIRQFYPYASISHADNRFQHRGEMSTTNTLIDVVTKGFQVNISSINIRQKFSQWFFTHISSRNEYIPNSLFMRQSCRIHNVLYISQRFRISIGNTWLMMFLTYANDTFRRKVVTLHLLRKHLRDVVILTIQATEITTRTREVSFQWGLSPMHKASHRHR